MKKVFFLLLPVFLFADISSDLLYSCHQNNLSSCDKVGLMLMDKFGSFYNPPRAVEPLKKACQYGHIVSSCKALSSYYISINDSYNSLSYLKIGCSLNDDTSCYLYHQRGGN